MEQPPRKSRLAPPWIILILLVDVGILALAWMLYQKREHNSYDAAGLAVSQLPQQSEEAPEPAPDPDSALPAVSLRKPLASSPVRWTVSGAESLPVQRPAAPGGAPTPGPGRRPAPAARPQPAPAARPQPAPAAQPQPAAAAPPSGRGLWKSPAEQVYLRLLHSPKFQNSKVIQSWKKEFMSYPDLRAINHRYHEDGNPLKFLSGAVRSNNFQRMLGRYLGSPDIQQFITSMAGSPSVVTSASQFMAADAALMNMGRAMGLAGGLPKNGAPHPTRR